MPAIVRIVTTLSVISIQKSKKLHLIAEVVVLSYLPTTNDTHFFI